jgi:HSP20 family protein
VDQDALDITVEDRALAIRGQRGMPSEHQPSSYQQMEISHGPFERIVHLPASVEPDRTTATTRNGMLEVCMPKARRQHVAIRVSLTEPVSGS